MKWIKKLLAVIVLLFIIAVLVVIGLMMFVDPNRLKPVIIEEVKKRSGYELQIDGPLAWSFYPRIGVKIEHMTLRAPQEKTPSIDLRDVSMATDFPPVLRSSEKLNGNIHIDAIQFINLHANDADVKFSWKDNVLTIHSLKADLYDGTLIATAHARGFSTQPTWDWDGQMDGVEVRAFLQDLHGTDSKINISGTGHLQFKGETQGKTKEQLLSNLNGNTEFGISNGSIDGIDLNYYILAADALINKQSLPPLPEVKQTLFSQLSGTAVIKNGVMETTNLLLSSPTFITKGTGKLYLISQTINLQLQIKSEQAIKTQWEIPVQVTGNLSHPDVQLDASELEKYIAREELTKVKAKASEIINKHVPGKAGEYLQNLLGK